MISLIFLLSHVLHVSVQAPARADETNVVDHGGEQRLKADLSECVFTLIHENKAAHVNVTEIKSLFIISQFENRSKKMSHYEVFIHMFSSSDQRRW